MTERDMLLKKIGTLKFAITDIDIFLDTHPGDTEMLSLRNQYESELKPLVEKFEKQFGALTKTAVIEFQKANGLNADGMVGAETKEVLYSVNAKPKTGGQ